MASTFDAAGEKLKKPEEFPIFFFLWLFMGSRDRSKREGERQGRRGLISESHNSPFSPARVQVMHIISR